MKPERVLPSSSVYLVLLIFIAFSALSTLGNVSLRGAANSPQVGLPHSTHILGNGHSLAAYMQYTGWSRPSYSNVD